MAESVKALLNSSEVLIQTIREFSDVFLPGNIPNIQFSSQSIDLGTHHDATSFSEKSEFESCFGQEMEQIAKMESMTAQGQRFVHMLYTFRSVSRAIPIVSMETPDGATREIEEEIEMRKEEINRKIVEILRPEILKLKELMIFIGTFVSVFYDCIQYLVSPEARERLIPDGIYVAIIKAIDLMVKLDNLKDQKTSITKDFTRYKRTLTHQTNSRFRITAMGIKNIYLFHDYNSYIMCFYELSF